MDTNLTEILLYSLIEDDIHVQVRKMSEYLNCPIMLTDVGYNLIAHYPDKKMDDPLWDAIHEFETTPPAFVNKLYIESMMPLALNNKEPYYLGRGFLEHHPRVLMNLCSKTTCYGYLAVLQGENTPEFFEKVKLMGDVCTLSLQKSFMGETATVDYSTMFLKYLFDEKGTNKEQIRNWLQYLPVSVKPPFYVGYCSCNVDGDIEQTASYIESVIKKAYPGTLFMQRKKNLVFLFTSMKSEEHVHSLIRMLQDSLQAYRLCFGVSNKYCELEASFSYLKQARFAWSVAGTKKLSIMMYRDCILDQMISVIYATLPREQYVHEAIGWLSDYDRENNTEYLKTLRVYIRSMCSAKKTVEELHIHRNTLPHRLEMIEKIGHIDLNDVDTCTVLLMNFFMETDSE